MKHLILLCLLVTAPSIARAAVISPPAQPSASAAGHSSNPQFSAGGRHLVFVSAANNLVTNDDLGLWLDVFVHDLVTSNTVLVSVSTNGTGGANWDANYPSISSNGQFVAFASRASNLVAGDTNDAVDVFVRDVVAGTTRLVSVDGNGNSAFDPAPFSNTPFAGNPLVSADGRWVFFESRATNLLAGGAPLGTVNLYRRDLLLNTTALVSADTNGAAVSGQCRLASITPDGGRVAFLATNAELTGEDPGARSLFVRDMQTGVTTWEGYVPGVAEPVIAAQLSENGTHAVLLTAGVSNAVVRRELGFGSQVLGLFASNGVLSINADATRVAYESDGYARLWIYDSGGAAYPFPIFQTNRTANPVLSRDGQALVFLEATSPAASQWQIHRWTGTTNFTPVSLTPTGSLSSGDFLFSPLAVNGDGSRVAFHALANDLVADDRNGASDIFVRDMNAGATALISQAAPARPPTTAFAHSFLGPNSVSADGRFVVSTRHDDPSAHRDTNGLTDVFATDALNGTSLALSINTNLYYPTTDGEAAASAGMFIANTNIFRNPVISADGSTVMAVWQSAGYYTKIFGVTLTNGLLNSKSMSLVTRSMYGYGVPANVDSPSLSADGRRLAFRSDDVQNAFVPGDSDGYSDIWLRYTRPREYPPFPLLTNYTKVSGYGSAGGPSVAPMMSADGGTVLFATRGGYLLTESAGGVAGQYANYQILAARIGTNYSATNELGSFRQRLCSYTITFQPYSWIDAFDTNIQRTNLNAILTPVPVDVSNAVFSANNRFIVYAHADGGSIWRHDLLATQTNYTFSSQAPAPNHTGSIVKTNLVPSAPNSLVCSNCRNPSVSADGNVVAYERVRAGSTIVDLFARDLNGGGEQLVSANLAGVPANGSSTAPSVSGDGRYVVFASKASDLAAGDGNAVNDVFVRDRILGVTMRVSLGNGPSTRPVLAANGRTVVFQSHASDLVAGDYNDKRDLFVVTLGGADSEPDGMDDDWEMAYFETLARDGTLDWDGDGATDLAEFLAGTDPKNSGSIFRVITVAPAGGGGRLLLWSGNPARSYRAEYKDGLAAPGWTALTGGITWNGTTASTLDTTAGSATNRFYRVLRLP